MVVRSTGPGESSSVLYDPQELAFIAYINDPSHKNSSRLSYAQYRDYKYWCEHPNEPSHGPYAANIKNRSKDFIVRDSMLYRKPYTVSEGTRSERSFGFRRVIQADYVCFSHYITSTSANFFRLGQLFGKLIFAPTIAAEIKPGMRFKKTTMGSPRRRSDGILRTAATASRRRGIKADLQ